MPNTYGYRGDIVGNVITGNASGSFSCIGQGAASATFVLGGPFNATRGPGGAAPGASPPATQPPAGGGAGARKSHKQKLLLDGVGSVF